MASSKKNVYQLRHNDNKAVLRVLNELYGKSLHISIIESVAKSQQWQRKYNFLTVLINNLI